MSGSPKHCSARLREAEERRLREERARRAEQEEEQRRREEERRRKQRLADAKNAAAEQVAFLRTRLSQFAAGEAANFVSGPLSALRLQVETLAREIELSGEESLLNQKMGQLAQSRAELDRVMARGEAEKLATGLAKEEAALGLVKRLVQSLDQHRSLKFDAERYRELKQVVIQAEQALQRKSLAETERLVIGAQAKLDQHCQFVDEEYQRWSQQRDQANTAVARIHDTLAGLQVDKVVMRWQGKPVAQLLDRARRLQESVAAGNYSPVKDATDEITRDAQQIIGAAQEFQLKEERRIYIVQGILDVMQRMGFVTEPNPPELEHPDYPDSAMIIQARRIGGSALAVSVPQQGDLWYAVDGFPMRVEASASNAEIKTCDEAQAEIEKLHRSLKTEFGIETGDLLWEGKDPDRIQKRAERLPDYASSTSPAQRARQQPH